MVLDLIDLLEGEGKRTRDEVLEILRVHHEFGWSLSEEALGQVTHRYGLLSGEKLRKVYCYV